MLLRECEVSFPVECRIPIWETAPHGVVSLLEMLDFAAREYVEMSYLFGVVLTSIKGPPPNKQELATGLKRLLADADALGLPITKAHLGKMLGEFFVYSDGKEPEINDDAITKERIAYYLEAVYETMRAEIGAIAFMAVPRERLRFSNGEWLKDSAIATAFPTSRRELEKAGACYALGQGTACVFHSMRAMEPALNSLAEKFNKSFSQENWQNIIEQIESEVREIGKQPKSTQKMEDEKFYGAAISHFYFIKNAWRNHVAHTRDTYEDGEARKISEHTMQFIESLSGRLNEKVYG